ncbi:MAG: 3-hydroxybutyrate dehydrogenase [Chlamydiia bacterium]|nr:3-hydroxybutyrate dehydrogenase [Chlamydiia bacterium]
MGSLSNKVAFITGSASGIGKAIAECYAKEGAKVAIADLKLEQAEAVAKEIAETYHTQAIGVAVDVSDKDHVYAAIDQTVKELGSLDIVNANAGIQIIKSIVDFDYAEFKKLVDIHLGGSFLTAQAGMKQMIQRKIPGRIIITGSVHSFEASLNKSAYVSAKHGLLGLTRAIAKEGAPYGITANLIAPGFVYTHLVEKQIPEQAQTLGITPEEVVNNIMLGQTVDKKFTTVEDVALASLFFASFPSTALSGQSLIISHGWFMS